MLRELYRRIKWYVAVSRARTKLEDANMALLGIPSKVERDEAAVFLISGMSVQEWQEIPYLRANQLVAAYRKAAHV